MAINKDQLRELIVETLKEIDLYSESAVELLMGTAAVESNLGEYIKQKNGGPALGIFQVEPKTHDDIWANYLHYKSAEFRSDIFVVSNILVKDHKALRHNLKYSIIMARLVYYRVSEELPAADDLEGLSYFWKEHYNTFEGKGRQTDFIDKYVKYVKS